MPLLSFLNRSYDAYLDWRFSRTEERRRHLSTRLLGLEEQIRQRRQIAWPGA